MDIGSILLNLAVLALVVVFVARPLRRRVGRSISPEEHEYSALLAERDRLLTALLELDFDYDLGKIPEEIYPTQRADFLTRSKTVLEKLDQFEGQTGKAADEFEAAIAERKEKITQAADIG